jgi:hypothetical protein
MIKVTLSGSYLLIMFLGDQIINISQMISWVRTVVILSALFECLQVQWFYFFICKSKLYFCIFLVLITFINFCSSSKTLLTDPTNEEEGLSSGIVTIVVQEDKLCSVHKPGGSPLTDSQLQECIGGAMKRAEHINKLINTALKSLST